MNKSARHFVGGVIENVPTYCRLQPSREYKLYLRTNAIYDGCSVTALSKLVTFTYYLKFYYEFFHLLPLTLFLFLFFASGSESRDVFG